MRRFHPGRVKARTVNLFPALVIACAVLLAAGSALAASNPAVDDCPDARSSDGDTALDLSVVDLTADAAAEIGELDPSAPFASDSTAPLLYLAPRVETIVRDVFGADSDGVAEPAVLRGTPMTPLADSVEDESVLPAAEDGDDSMADDVYSPLRIHREMYRTDI